jgi:hypothetical protein
MELWECRTSVGVLLFDKFEFTPFKGKTIVVVGMHIPITTIVLLWMGQFKLVNRQDSSIRPKVPLFHSKG